MQFLLGVNDPEMQGIERLLSQHGYAYQYAMKDGRRVHPGNAYEANLIEVQEGETLVLVECEPRSYSDLIQVIRVDHHRPGDPGYGASTSEFWRASSLGQICNLLDVTPTQDMLILAAMDHCPAAAIRGECPGVSAEEVIERKVTEIAAATNNTPGYVRIRIGVYIVRLREAPAISIGKHSLQDLRSCYLGEGYNLDFLSAQVAALADGHTALLRHRDAVGKPEKLSITGHATPELIEVFMQEWAPAQGLTGIYGVPARGYAGGYLLS